jgi:putative endopeptidase
MTSRRHVIIALATTSMLALAGCATNITETAPTAAVEVPPTPAAPARPAAELGTFGFDLAGMDRSVTPGDDFYAFANGTWARSTVIPDDKSNYGMFTRLSDLSLERTRGLLDEARRDPNNRVGRAYASFLDEAGVEARGLAPIQPWLTRIAAARTRADILTLQAEGERAGVPGLFSGYVNQDDRDPDTYIYQMQQSGIGMPDRDYYLENNERYTGIRAQYLTFLQAMLTAAGQTNVAPRAQAIMAYETRLARAHWNRIDSSDATKTYNKFTIAALQRAAPGFDFATYLRGIGVTNSDVLVAQPTAFTAMAREFSRTPVGVLRDQMLVRSLSTFADELPAAVGNADFAFYGTALSGTPRREERWKRAVQFATGAVGDELSQQYVARYYPPATKAAMDELVGNILSAMGRRIDNLSWMQPETKRRARAKLANFTVKIGYPSQWRSYDGLDMRADDLFGNAWRSANFEHDYMMGKLGTPVRRWEWFMTPMTVNAYANFGMNEIVFPAAILQPPFFDPNADPAINYGGIGAVIGHEISHHFDDQGAKYDENGRLADWWTPQDVAAFTAAGRRLVEQYNLYEVLGENINGEFTLGENIGDLAGLSIAYDAYRASLNGVEAPVIDGMTGDQRFFLGWAQVWRRNYRDANLLQRMTTDPHSPSQQRAWVVRNLDPWYDAFAVQPGARLYLSREERVRIW